MTMNEGADHHQYARRGAWGGYREPGRTRALYAMPVEWEETAGPVPTVVADGSVKDVLTVTSSKITTYILLGLVAAVALAIYLRRR